MQEFREQLEEHFDLIEQGISDRYDMAYSYCCSAQQEALAEDALRQEWDL